MRKALLAGLAVPVLLAGCQTWGPTWSELTGQRYNTVVLNRRPAIIERVDDQGAFAQQPIRIEPGKHLIMISAPAPGWQGGSSLERFYLDVEPCKRYYINAQFDDPLQPSFRPVVDFVETIPGCTVTPKK